MYNGFGSDYMKVIDALDWSNWKNYSVSTKRDLFSQILAYYVSPLKQVSNITLSQFELAGVKCETFEVNLDEETFVFLPGKKGAILGWDSGTQPLPAFYWNMKNAIYTKKVQDYQKNYGLQTTEEWDVFINESTSSLRQVDVAPMLVAKYALPVGCSYLGEFHAVTGEFIGTLDEFAKYEEQIKQALTPPQNFEDSLFFEFPNELFHENQFYAKLNPELESYTVYSHQLCTQEQLRKSLQKEVMDLMNEDQWEYAVGGTTRRLFRWGNELLEDHSFWKNQIHKIVSRPNMFGLSFAGDLKQFEITADQQLKLDQWEYCQVPLLDYLPLSTYYRPRKSISPFEILSPKDYTYRKAIIIEA